MLFDEATSSLDTVTESQIQQALDELVKGRSSIIIAHRLSTIVGCDKIIFLKQGVISEAGTHEELLTLGGDYSKLWERQNRMGTLEKDLRNLQMQEHTQEVHVDIFEEKESSSIQ